MAFNIRIRAKTLDHGYLISWNTWNDGEDAEPKDDLWRVACSSSEDVGRLFGQGFAKLLAAENGDEVLAGPLSPIAEATAPLALPDWRDMQAYWGKERG